MRRGVFCVVVFLALIGSAFADPTITVIPASAPNAYGSPSFAAWQANAIYALEHGLSTYGPAGPTQYNAAPSTMPYSDNVVTGFPSWLSQVDPGTVFGPAYANELGNRMTFGVVINGNGTQFSISQLSFDAVSTDPWDYLGFGWAAGSYDYSNAYVGVIFGTGGAPDTYITSGPNTQLVDALFGRGSGNAGPAYCPGCTLNQQQAAIWDQQLQFFQNPPNGVGGFDFTGAYSLAGTGSTGSATVHFTAVPEPATISLLAIGALAAIIRRKRP